MSIGLWPEVDEALVPASVFADVIARSMLADPILNLLDPNFTPATWFYERSRNGSFDLPGALHAKQWEALNSSARHRWLFWGNQTGKTTLGAIDLVLKALGRHPLQLTGELVMPPRGAWSSALTWELWEKMLLPELLTWIPVDRVLRAPPPRQKSTNRDIIVLADNGAESIITGKAAEQGADLYQSARVHDIWLDEEHPEAVYDEMQPRLLRFGGRTMGTMTPLKGMTWVYSRVYEPWKNGRSNPQAHYVSHAGLADNPSITPEAVAELTSELRNNPAQLEARLYGHFVKPTGTVLPFDPAKHLREYEAEELAKMIARPSSCYAGVDLGKWRFWMGFAVADLEGRLHLVDELFSQNEDTDTRATAIHDLLTQWKVKDINIRADCADPMMITEMNKAFTRAESPYRMYAVDARHKIIAAGIERLESMLNRGAFFVRRGIGTGMNWRLGASTSRPGKPIEGSRWIWEINNWQYPKTIDGKIQKDEPDDATADGGDAMDGTRYFTMTYWAASEPAVPRVGLTLEQRVWKELQDDTVKPKSAAKYGKPLRQ